MITYREAARIADIATKQLAGNMWSNEARGDLALISCAALGHMDHLDGHEGFEGKEADLEARLTAWAEGTDYRTFPDYRERIAA